MQINPITIEKASMIASAEVLMEKSSFYQLALYASISYYAIATEMRLLSNDLVGVQEKNKKI